MTSTLVTILIIAIVGLTILAVGLAVHIWGKAQKARAESLTGLRVELTLTQEVVSEEDEQQRIGHQ